MAKPSLARESGHDFRRSTFGYGSGIALSIWLFAACGCASVGFPAAEAPSVTSAAQDVRVDRVLMEEGLKKLREQRYEDASRIFNAGLKFAPTNAQLHFLNGLAYHLLYLRGDDAAKELGITGYELALNHEPAYYHAALQLGWLQFDAKRYRKSAQAFRRAAEIRTNSGEAYIGLASAAYYARDLRSARAAAQKAVALLPADADAMRALAITNAALGDRQKALEAAARYAVLEPAAGARLNARVEQWYAWRVAATSPDAKSGATSTGTPPDSASDEPSEDESAQADAQPAAPGRVFAGAMRPAWFDCGPGARGASGGEKDAQAGNPTGGPLGGPSGGFLGSDSEIGILPALPSPCEGAGNPRMVVMDVAFIRTEDNNTTAYGINLLQGLAYVFGRIRTVTDTLTQSTGQPDSRQIVIATQTRSGTPDGFLRYSLNVANSTENRSEVLARPSLVALDRMPSTFFSGRNITLGISGQAGGASLIADKPIGVGLSVTPTFIDAETLLLAIRSTRSFVQSVDTGVNFGQSLQTSRNSVAANVILKMGQTLILSGLAEQERQRQSNGVPVLKDIPVLQYLFNQRQTLDFTSSVLVLITPRIPSPDSEIMSGVRPAIDQMSDPKKRAFGPLIDRTAKNSPDGVPGNLGEIYRHALGNPLFLQFRSGDLGYQSWSKTPRLNELLRDITESLYF